MIDITRVCIIITHMLIGLGIVLGTILLIPFTGFFAPVIVLIVCSPMVVLWFMATTAWDKYMLEN